MNNFSHTDLASEIIKVKGRPFDGVCKLSEIDLDDALAEKFGKAPGKYVTLETDVLNGSEGERERLSRALRTELRKLLPDRRRLLVVGLGNAALTADALGAEVCAALTVSDARMALAPSVAGNTGIESFDIVKGVCERVRPTAVLVVDSLAAASTERVCRVIQMCDAGITPGSGVSNHRERLSVETLGVPVVSVGVPLVVYASTIIRDAGGDDAGFESLIVTPKDIDALVRSCAGVIASAIDEI